MLDKIATDTRMYGDFQELDKLRYQATHDKDNAKKEVSKQFEAMLMQIVIQSMRDANKAFSSDLFGDDQMDIYQDMYDKQLAMITSNSGTGFASIVEKNIDNQSQAAEARNHVSKNIMPNETSKPIALSAKIPATGFALIPHKKTELKLPEEKEKTISVITDAEKETPKPKQTIFNSADEFVKTLWSSAKSAAKMIGVDPKILLAQAALETNWGKKILPQGNDSSHNLFNIKADVSWDKKTTAMATTLEQKDGIVTKEKAKFRSYDSYVESFNDYVNFLKENNRYSKALDKAGNPQQFIQGLQHAGFATDTQYAEKILTIFSSSKFKTMVADLK